ncbi:hypothetical protein G9A89_010131 [Geosiphon pyriformis]|nr:hypothetical protein G9A89_010131 [Geosiphon pyriformis]
MSKISHVHHFRPINSDNKKRIFVTIVVNKDTYNSEFPAKSRTISTLTSLCTNDTTINLSASGISSSNLSTAATSNLSTTTATNNLSTPTNSNTTPKLTIQWNTKTENSSTELEIVLYSNHLNYASRIWVPNYLSLLITPKDASANNLESAQKQPLTSNISPATITEDEFLTAIFSFEFEETTAMPLFNEAALEAKPITVMYMDAKVDGQSIKLILNSGLAVDYAASARIITANRATKMPIGKIDEFPFKVNGIITSIKVLVMEATQYQALVGNDWLVNGQYTHVPATCDHFKSWKKKKKAYLKSLPSFVGQQQPQQIATCTLMERQRKEKRRRRTYLGNKLRIGKGKKQKEEPKQTTSSTHIPYTTPPQNAYHRPKLVCVSCGKKLSIMNVCCSKNEEWMTATEYYYGTLYLACGDTFLDEGMWKDIPGREGACNETCQYTILIND